LRHKRILVSGALLAIGIAALGFRHRQRDAVGGAKPETASGHSGRPARIPLWLKITYGVATPTIAGFYWRHYGPKNFLWLSDIALASTAVAVITEKRLPASMPAVGVLPLELAWNLDFVSGGKALGLAAYMFDRKIPAALRLLSLFHVALPPTLLYALSRLGYDRRAFAYQTGLVWTVLPLTYALTKPEQNVNWVFGPGRKPQRRIPPLLYLLAEMAVLPVLVFLPMHVILEGVFGSPKADGPA
jgi:hypothetical protein